MIETKNPRKERGLLHTQEVTGSSPVAPTMFHGLRYLTSCAVAVESDLTHCAKIP